MSKKEALSLLNPEALTITLGLPFSSSHLCLSVWVSFSQGGHYGSFLGRKLICDSAADIISIALEGKE